MKMKKKTIMVLSFTLGALLFASTAIADILDKRGYEQLKDAIKLTAEKCSDEFDSFTIESFVEVKDNGKIVLSESNVSKHDYINKATLSNSQSSGIDRGSSMYYYTDQTTNIRKSMDDETYYVTEFPESRKINGGDNPFEEEAAKDIERIIDALVGNLKDHVIVNENPDGSKELSGTLTEIQIPALVNAVASFQMKQQYNGRRAGLSDFTEDIYIKEVSGKAQINEEGLLENIWGKAAVSGVDKQGDVHEITLEVLVKIKDVNTTKVEKPNLEGKKVVREKGRTYNPGISNPEKFIGKYQNDIIIEQDGKFIKVGERKIQIAHMDGKTVEGRYYEELKEGFEQYGSDYPEFNFAANIENEGRSAVFEIQNESENPINGNIHFDDYTGKIHMNLNIPYNQSAKYDSMFNPVLE